MLAQKLLSGGEAAQLYSDDVFSAYTYTGNGSTQTITNGIDLATNGGMVWVKSRDTANIHNLWDSGRGLSAYLDSASTNAQAAQGATSFTSSGFTFGTGGSVNNGSTITYVSWTFRKAPKFFDVVTWSGDNTSPRSIPHSLGSVPGMILIKVTNTSADWYVQHRALSSTTDDFMRFNTTNAKETFPGVWGTGPTATDFKVTSVGSLNSTGLNYVAYLFAHDTDTTNGIIQCGSFTTDGSGNATVTLGWEPQYLMVKVSSTTGGWFIHDTSRGFNNSGTAYLYANTSGAEVTSTTNYYKPTATGFVVTADVPSVTYVYMAIRRPNKPPTTGTQVYNAIARTGTGAAATVTGVGFAPDLVAPQVRVGATIWGTHFWDRLRGSTPNLNTTSTAAERTTDTTALTSFNMDGVSVGADPTFYINNSGYTYINWFFKRAPGVFDEVCYTGTGFAKTEAHNLGVVPELMIIKSRSAATQWPTYAASLGNTSVVFLSETVAVSTGAPSYWNSTTPTSSVFSLGSAASLNTNTATYVAYLFATKAGVSKVGSYTGNGSNQTINAGFTTGARFILIKRTDSTGDWYVWDSVRGINPAASNDPHLSLNTTAAEVTTDDSIRPDNTGFIVNQLAATNINVTSATYIYLSFA